MNNSVVKNFQGVPKTNWARTRFTPRGEVFTSLSAGKLVPIAVEEVLPNTTTGLNLFSVVRGITPLAPVLDNAFMDVFAFYVPNRLSWDHWEDFLSEPTPAAYENAPQYSVPQITFSSFGGQTYQNLLAGTFWDYAGIGAASADTNFVNFPALSALYPRGYVRIWNDWFRDQNIQDFAHCYTDDADRSFSSSNDPLISAEFGNALLPVAKYKDYFTSALPQPQKGPPVSIPVGTSAPLVGTASIPSLLVGNSFMPPFTSSSGAFSPRWYDDGGALVGATNQKLPLYAGADITGESGATKFGPSQTVNLTSNSWLKLATESGSAPLVGTADLSSATSASVNALRLAFQTQRFQERLARSGSRYTELLRSMFGIYASDARLQRSEFLGGRRFPIRQFQVAQTTENDGSETIGLGDTGAFTFTNDSTHRFVDRSFPEHGIVYYLACIRTSQSYSQGVHPRFTRRNRFDYYFPTFAHIGEQPIRLQEIYAGTPDNQKVFGYKEPWVEYKYFENRVTAKMRPYVASNFGIWTYTNNFASAPSLSPSFIVQDVANIDRTLAVSSSVQDQFFASFYFQFYKQDLCMPAFNEPGLIDHY